MAVESWGTVLKYRWDYGMGNIKLPGGTKYVFSPIAMSWTLRGAYGASSGIKKNGKRVQNQSIKSIVIHYTAGRTSVGGTANGVKKSWGTSGTNAEFVVDDTTILQVNPNIDRYRCGAVGDAKNSDNAKNSTISIEVCSTLSNKIASDGKPLYDSGVPLHCGWYYTTRVLSNTLCLVKRLREIFGNLPLKRHYDISGKWCPGILGWIPKRINLPRGKHTPKIVRGKKIDTVQSYPSEYESYETFWNQFKYLVGKGSTTWSCPSKNYGSYEKQIEYWVTRFTAPNKIP